MVAIIGGEPKRFRPLVDLCCEAGRRAGHSPDKLIVGLHSIGFLGDITKQAADVFIQDTRTRSPRSARNAAGPQL